MAVPVLQLNLAPRPSFWRQRHLTLGWLALGTGFLILVGASGFTWRAFHKASRAGRDAVSLTEETRRTARQQQQLQVSLQDIDAAREQSRWKLAERILQERSMPWSRLTTEIEQCMVPDMRMKGLQRSRSNAQQVVMKLKGEARTRLAEAAFVEALRATPVFAQVVLERESERTGGGWEFEISLPTAAVPPPFQVKAVKQGPAQAPVSSAPRPSAALAAPARIPTPVAPPIAAVPGPPVVRPASPVPPPTGDEEAGPRRRRPSRARPGGTREPE